MARLGGVRFVGLLGTLTLMAGVFGVGVGSTPAGASTYTNVNTEAGLRTAFGDSSATLIDLTANITLTNCGAGPVSRSSSTALVVNGDSHTVTQTCPDSVFSQALAGSLTFQNITITGGDINGALLEGGGIYAGGTVTVTNSTITANSITGVAFGSVLLGGGIYAGGTVTVTNSTITANSLTGGSGSIVQGGGIYAGGTVTVTNSTITGNSANGGSESIVQGGGIYAGSMTLTNSTITGNSANGGSESIVQGGGIFAGSSVTVTNSTITANSLTGGTLSIVQGGGIYAGGTVTLVYATIVDNTAATAANIAGELTSFGSVVAQPLGGGANCALSLTTSHGYNLEDDAGASCGFSTGTDDLAPGTNPDLGLLGFNGGPTQTMVPEPDSPLINGIPNGSCESDGASGIMTDQRGFPRPSPPGGACDIGAVQVQSTTLVASATLSQWKVLDGLFVFRATLTAMGQGVAGQKVTFTLNNAPRGSSCTAITNSSGVATCELVVRPFSVALRIHSFTASYGGSVGYLPSSTTGTIHS
jgi:hypothetical protein